VDHKARSSGFELEAAVVCAQDRLSILLQGPAGTGHHGSSCQCYVVFDD
jgi:hypothetical protein